MTELLQENLPAMVEWVRDISPQLWAMARQEILVTAYMAIIIPFIIVIPFGIITHKIYQKLHDESFEHPAVMISIIVFVISVVIGTGFVIIGIYQLFTIDYETLLSLRQLLIP